MKNYTETERQKLAEKLVNDRNEVLCLLSRTVDNYIAPHHEHAHGEPFIAACENVDRYLCPECGEEVSVAIDEDTATQTYQGSGWELNCPCCSHSFDPVEAELNTKEVFEWWGVTDWLADKLRARGEVIFDGPDVTIWGRCTTGQAIILDDVIQRIAVEVMG